MCGRGTDRKKEAFMMSKGMLLTTLGCFGAIVALGQAPPPAAPQQGPGVQAPADARYAEWVASKCKTPPAPRGGGGARAGAPAGGAAAAGAARGAANNATAGPPEHRDY